MALVDSGNTAANAMSYSLASTIGVSGRIEPYSGPKINTAKKDASLRVIGVIRRLEFRIKDDKGRAHRFTSSFIIIDKLSNGINISLPWLIRHRFDQIHTEGILKRDGVKYPVYSSYHLQKQVGDRMVTIEHKIAYRDADAIQTTSEGKEPSIVEITSDECLPVYNRNPHCYRTKVPPNTGVKLNIQLADGRTLDDSLHIFEFSEKFLNRLEINQVTMGSHGDLSDINYFPQLVRPEDGELKIQFLNNSPQEVFISHNCHIGSVLQADGPLIPSPKSQFSDDNIAYNKLSKEEKQKRLELVISIIKKQTHSIQGSEYFDNCPRILHSVFTKPPESLKNNYFFLLVCMLIRHWSVFYREGNPGGTNIVEHPIYTPKGVPPIKLKNRPVNPGLANDLQEQIDTWLKEGVIKKSRISPWNFPLHAVKKKNGKWRWVVDFRALNNITRKDTYPIPNIQELLSYLSGSRYFSSLDLASAFHSIPIRPCDQEKVSFSALDKQYQFVKMPFGLTSAPNTWARLVTEILQHIPKTKLVVFFDDLLIHSRSLPEHLSTLEEVLTCLRQAGLRINLEKSRWIQPETRFLGHDISHNGVKVPQEFTKIINEWPLPETLKQLRSFAGKCNYYRRHIPNYAIISAPLMEHLKGTTESGRKLYLEKDSKAIDSFNRLKQQLMSPSVLAYPDFNSKEPFILDCDYSGTGIGNVLSQLQDGKERPIAYAARRLKQSESHYSSYKGELLALIFAIEQHKFFLTGRKFIVRTDNSALTWLKAQKDPKGLLLRWLRTLASYEFDVQHRAGTKHANADALSRAPHAPYLSEQESKDLLDEHILVVSSLEDEGLLEKKVLMELQSKDELISKVIGWVKSNTKPILSEYKLLNSNEKLYADNLETLSLDHSGILIKQTGPQYHTRICLPLSEVPKILESLHCTNHCGGNQLAQIVGQRYFFPRLVSTCREFVATCARCQKNRAHSPQRHTYAHDLVGSPGEKLCIDFVGPLHRTRKGNVAILTAVDCYTKWFDAWPVKDQTANTVIKHLVKDYIPHHGVPATVHSDNGPAFISQVFREAMRKFDVRATTTPTYNACSNTVERYHRTLNSRLKALIHDMNEEWDELLPAVLFAMRTSVNRTTGYTPFFLTYGREARFPIDLVYGSVPLEERNTSEHVQRLHNTFQSAYDLVSRRQNDYIQRQRSLYQEKARVIQVDDLVWLFTKRPNPVLNRKFQCFYSGPYKVIRQVSNTIFEIESYGKWCSDPITTIAAVDRLKKCTIRDPETNEGIPIDLKASDVAPYYEEGEEMLGKIPVSQFSPHIFKETSALPFVDGPPAAGLDVTPPIIGPDFHTWASAPEEPVGAPVAEPPAPLVSRPSAPIPDAPVEPDSPPTENPPIREPPVPETPPARADDGQPTAEAQQERPVPPRPRGRPLGARNKVYVCSKCSADGLNCAKHCRECSAGMHCPYHTERDRCRFCTRRRRCARHSLMAIR